MRSSFSCVLSLLFPFSCAAMELERKNIMGLGYGSWPGLDGLGLAQLENEDG